MITEWKKPPGSTCVYKKVFIFIFLLIHGLNGFSLSDSLQVSVLTLEPGTVPYTIFGHTAIRVRDTVSRTDRVYNFGSFDFDTPHFYWKFLKGDLMYFLAATSFRSYMHESEREHRVVWEQHLDLSIAEKQKIARELERCYHSADRYYRYDFFRDNCATRVRNVIFGALDRPVRYDTMKYCCKTFRQLLDPLFSVNYGYDLGINLVLGKEADRTAPSYDFMFLPVYIMEILEDTRIANDKRLILDASVRSIERSVFSYVLPWVIAACLMAASLWRRTRKAVFYTVLSAVGVMGLFLLFVSLISVNSGFRHNLNVVWMLPALLVLFIPDRRINDAVKILYVASLIVMILARNHLPQELPLTFLPCLVVLLFVLVLDLNRLKR